MLSRRSTIFVLSRGLMEDLVQEHCCRDSNPLPLSAVCFNRWLKIPVAALLNKPLKRFQCCFFVPYPTAEAVGISSFSSLAAKPEGPVCQRPRGGVENARGDFAVESGP